MSESMKRVVLPGLMLLGMNGCGADGVMVWLHVKNVTGEVATLQVGLTLDGRPATQQYEFRQGLGEVAIKLRKEQLGQGQLSVALYGLRADRCKVSTGTYAAKVSVDTPYAEVDVTLATMSPMTCPLTVEKVGEGSVTSSPAGVNCGTSCTMDVPLGGWCFLLFLGVGNDRMRGCRLGRRRRVRMCFGRGHSFVERDWLLPVSTSCCIGRVTGCFLMRILRICLPRLGVTVCLLVSSLW